MRQNGASTPKYPGIPIDGVCNEAKCTCDVNTIVPLAMIRCSPASRYLPVGDVECISNMVPDEPTKGTQTRASTDVGFR